MQTAKKEKGLSAANAQTPMQTGVNAKAPHQRRQAPRLPMIEAPSQERIAALTSIRDKTPGQSSKQQCARLLAALRQLGLVSTYEASRHLDLYDPRARKMALCNAGHPIKTMWIVTATESEDLHRIGAYYLDRLGASDRLGGAAGTPIASLLPD